MFGRILNEAPWVKILLDIGHLFINHTEDYLTHLLLFLSDLGTEIAHLHLSDNRGTGDDHLPLGCGLIDWKKTLETVKRYYNGTITLEVFTPDREYLILSREKLKRWMEGV
ncbi:TPA: hypothetical protein DCX15_03160 [bacterium]|nr:hypothetical protein [bacterium]